MFTAEDIQALAEQLVANKALQTTDLVNGGLLSAEQSDRFITYMFDLTTLTKLRLVRMNRNKLEIEKIGIGTRLLRKASEYTTLTDASSFTLGKVTLTTTKLALPWDISRDTYKQNVERSGIEDTVQRLMAIQAGNDFEDVCINGTGTSTGLLSAFDGWLYQATTGDTTNATHLMFFSGSGLTKSIFSQMLKNLPAKYQSRRNDLRFYAPVNMVQDYIDTLSDRETILGDSLIEEGAKALAYGIPVISVPLLPATTAGTYPGASGNHEQQSWRIREIVFGKFSLMDLDAEMQIGRKGKQAHRERLSERTSLAGWCDSLNTNEIKFVRKLEEVSRRIIFGQSSNSLGRCDSNFSGEL